jgi:AcrR family transcriptional regulator
VNGPEPALAIERKRSPQERELRARERLVEAAREVFERDGFHAARIVDVANTAGVGIGTFYRHFESKGAMFRAVISNAFDEIYVGGATRTAENADPVKAIELANKRFLEQYREEAPIHSLLEQLAPVDEECRDLYLSGRARAVDRIAHSLQELQAEGLASPDLNAKVAAGALVAMVNNSAHLWFTMGEAYDEDVALDTINQLWISGIGLAEALRNGSSANGPAKPAGTRRPAKKQAAAKRSARAATGGAPSPTTPAATRKRKGSGG